MSKKQEINYNVNINYMWITTLLFVTLKLTSVINWKWLWVLTPLWGPIVLALLMVMTAYIILGVKGWLK